VAATRSYLGAQGADRCDVAATRSYLGDQTERLRAGDRTSTARMNADCRRETLQADYRVEVAYSRRKNP